MAIRISGRYTLVRELGRGASGHVWLAHDEAAGGDRRAVKVLEDRALAQRLSSEFNLLSRLRHPGLVRVYDLGEDPEAGPYLVMEVLEGRPLAHPTVEEAAQALRALAFIHARGVVHGDLKPGNVLCCGDGRVKLLDFGLATLQAAGATRESPSGTLEYLAPELLRGARPDARTDLYALGCLLHGGPPFTGTPREIIDGHLSRPPPPGRGPLAPLVARLLEKDPAKRPQTAAEALALLGPAHAHETPETARAYLRPPTLLGRDEELARLDALARSGGVVELRGVLGAGRSRLLDELARRVRLWGCRAAVVECTEGSPPLGPLREACARLGEPSLLPRALPSDPAAAADAAARAFARLAGPRGRALVALDAAEHADPITLAACAALARIAEGGEPVPLVVLTRPGGGPPAEAAALVEIEPLPRASLASWCALAYPGRDVPHGFVDALASFSGGFPALVEAALEDLHAGGVAIPGACESGPLPERPALRARGVEEALAARAAALPDSEREALFTAALARRIDLAARVAPRGALARLEEEGLWPPSGAVKRAVLSLLAPEHARALHAQLAAEAERSLAGEDAGRREETLADLAHHLRGAEDRRAPAAALAAGRAFAALARGPEAARWLEAALDAGAGDARDWLLLSQVRTATSDFAGALAAAERAGALGARAAARIAEAEAHQRAGAYNRAQAALAAALAAAPTPEERAEGLALLARVLSLAGDAHGALQRAAEGLAAAQAGSLVRGELEMARALAAWSLGRLEEAARSFATAAPIFAALGDGSRRAAAVNGLGLVHQREGRLDEAARAYQEALQLAEEAHDRARVATELLNLGTLAQQRGDAPAAERAYREAARTAHVLGDRAGAARATGNLAALYRWLGRLEEASAEAERARQLAEAAGARTLAAWVLMVEAEVAALREQWATAREKIEEARATFVAAGSVGEEIEADVNLCEIDLEQREGERALARALAAAERARAARLPVHEARALLCAGEAEAHRLGGEPRRAMAQLYAALALQCSLATPRPDLHFRLRAALARTAQAAGDQEEAAHHARRGLTILEEMAARLSPGARATFLARPDRRACAAALAALAPPRVAEDPRAARLLALNRKLGAERDLRALLTAIVDAAIELSGAERGFVLLPPDKPGKPPQASVARNIDRESLKQARFKVSRSIAERVMQTGQPELTVDAQEDDRYREQLSVHEMKLRSVLCVPLRFQGEVLGALYVDNRFKADAFGASDRALLEAFADQAAIALSHARALEGARIARAEAERARAEVEALNARLTARVAAAEAELVQARREIGGRAYGRLVGSSPAMRRVYHLIERLSQSALPVLITGESGTGKELVARALHAEGPRREKPFVTVNCAAMPEGLLESELFGHVRGAFTGADREREGLFKAAHGGTLFLDEVGDMGPAMQVKLLRVLQDGEIRKVGGRDAEKVDARVLCATNRDLAQLVREGKFREDLYYRLAVVGIHLPPLRERREDIPALVERFLAELPPHASGKSWRIDAEGMALLASYPWPGNVRELEATVRYAAVFAAGPTIGVGDLLQKPELRGGGGPRPAVGVVGGRTIAELEMEAIQRTLELCGGNRRRAAELLGIDRKTLYNKLKHQTSKYST